MEPEWSETVFQSDKKIVYCQGDYTISTYFQLDFVYADPPPPPQNEKCRRHSSFKPPWRGVEGWNLVFLLNCQTPLTLFCLTGTNRIRHCGALGLDIENVLFETKVTVKKLTACG